MVKSRENEEETDIIQTRPPTPEEGKWFDYVDDLPFKSDEYLTTFADKLLGLNTALISAYIAGIKLASIRLSPHVFVPICLLILSLSCCLYSLYPRTAKGDFASLSVLRDRYLLGLIRRRKAISISFVTFFLGMLSAIVVLLLG